jgi:TolB-like protein/Tfp pilus assembly protein PilF
VQKAADQVRVNVQLINAQTDSHVWADTYDRKLTDIFGVESEIAKRITESLQGKLTGSEEQALAVKPTNNLDAYDAYLRGLAFEARSHSSSLPLVWKAAGFYERAVRFDPNFALAWARLSRAHALIYSPNTLRGDNTAARRDAAKAALENAQRLAPNSPETLLALGYYQYLVLRDYGPAKTTFERVSKMLPSSSEAPRALGLIARREGHWDVSIAYYERALALDPRNVELVEDAGWTYSAVRQFPAALKLYDRALDIAPNDPDVMASKACIYQAQGDLQEAARFLSEINWQSPFEHHVRIKITQLRLERNYAEAVRLLQARQAQFHFDSEYSKANNRVALALMQRLAGDAAGAKVTAEQARNTLEQLYRDEPDNARRAYCAGWLSQAYAVMGEKDSALKAAERAIMLLPRAKDALGGPLLEENRAFIQTIFGDNSHAISTLTELLQTAYYSWFYSQGPSPALLRLDPIWDPLRTDRAFQKLCEEKIDRSIAVLPFENLSADPENAYFADGIQDEILTRLSKVADLKVISRISTQHYKSRPENLPEIAKQLGVAHILEGSVQKGADTVRVNVQLIKAANDSNLWAETYDRKFTDILGVESEIAKGIAESLQAKLTGREEQALAAKPTDNSEAYDAYLRGLAFEGRNAVEADMQEKAIASYERAVQLDPNFALAWARLSRMDALLYFGRNNTAARRDAAKRALENAQKLQPNSPETLLALGYYQYWVLHDYGSAKTTFGVVSKMLPGRGEVPRALALIARREGHWDESIAYFEQALTLDPRNVEFLPDAAYTYGVLRRFPAALKLYDRALDIIPNNPWIMANKASIYQTEGNLKEAAKFLTHVNAQTPSSAFEIKIYQLKLERNYGEAIRLLQTRLAQFRYPSQFNKVSDQEELALIQRLAGDTAAAKATAEQVRNTLSNEQPENAFVVATLARAYAMLDEKGSALKEAQRAIMLVPSSKDRLVGPGLEENLAFIQMTFGDKSPAISTLTRLGQTPFSSRFCPFAYTPALLRLDPIWDPLRSDPRFQKLCEEKQP